MKVSEKQVVVGVSIGLLLLALYCYKKAKDIELEEDKKTNATGFVCPRGQSMEVVSDGRNKYFVCTDKRTNSKKAYNKQGTLVSN